MTATAATKQPLSQALDISAYDEIDALLQVVAAIGSSPTMTVRLISAMQAQSEDGWTEW